MEKGKAETEKAMFSIHTPETTIWSAVSNWATMKLADLATVGSWEKGALKEDRGSRWHRNKSLFLAAARPTDPISPASTVHISEELLKACVELSAVPRYDMLQKRLHPSFLIGFRKLRP
ncbi:hypothetical protein GN956_G17444 [Arapaima gigas]